jgi:hypothetical protein
MFVPNCQVHSPRNLIRCLSWPQASAIEGRSLNVSPRYRRRADAARYVRETWGLPCSPSWLAKLAVVGGGPVFRKAGRFPIYTDDDLDSWCQRRIGAPRCSTSASP